MSPFDLCRKEFQLRLSAGSTGHCNSISYSLEVASGPRCHTFILGSNAMFPHPIPVGWSLPSIWFPRLINMFGQIRLNAENIRFNDDMKEEPS